MSKSLLHSACVTVGNKMYIAGKKRKTYNVVKNTGNLKTAGIIKINKNRIAALRKGVKSNNLFWHTEIVKNKAEINKAIKTKPQSKKINASGNFSSQMATDIKDGIRNYTDSQGDSGTSTISTAIKAGEIGIKSFKAAETASPVVVNTIRRTGKGIYKVGRTTVKIANTIDRTAGKVILGTVKLNPETMKYFRKLAFDRAKQSGLIKNAVSQIQDVRENVVKIKNNIMTAKRYTANTVKFIGAVLDGTVAVRFTKEQLKQASVIALKSAGKTAKTTFKTAGKSLKTAGKVSANAADLVSNTLTQSQDTGVQALGQGIKTMRQAPKVLKTSGKILTKGARGIKTTVKAPVKTARNTVKAVRFVRANGFKGSARKVGSNAVKTVAKAGRSMVSALLNLVKKAALKFLFPVILITAVIAILMGAFSAPVAVVLDMFGGIITFFFGDGSNPDEKVEVVIEEYISEEAERGINKFYDRVNETINGNLVGNGGSFHIVRIFFGEDNEQISIDELIDNISASEELSKIIEPVFNTLVFQRYERRTSENQAKEIIDEICGKLFTTRTESKPMEYCGATHSCDSRHALADCYNSESGSHNSYTCSSCDSYAYNCDGHSSGHSFPGCYTLSCTTTHTHTRSCYSLSCSSSHTYYHTAAESRTMEENKRLVCNGYLYCNGHRVLGIYIEQSGLDNLLEEYFIKPIAELETLENRTESQEQELGTLKTNYSLCLDYINIIESRSNGD